MSASLKQIDAAFYAALSLLSVANGGPFGYVGRFRGEISQTHGIDTETMAEPVAVAFCLEGELPAEPFEVKTLAQGTTEVVGNATWRVYVALQRFGDSVTDLTATDGIFALLDLVVGRLNGLLVPAPPATLRFAVTGTASATATLGTSRLVVRGVAYQPTVTTVTLDSLGAATVDAACVTVGTVGAQNAAAPATWDATPTHLNNAAVVQSTVVAGESGLYRNERVVWVESRPHLLMPDQCMVYVARFRTRRALPKATPLATAPALAAVTANVNPIAVAGVAPVLPAASNVTPLVSIRASL